MSSTSEEGYVLCPHCYCWTPEPCSNVFECESYLEYMDGEYEEEMRERMIEEEIEAENEMFFSGGGGTTF